MPRQIDRLVRRVMTGVRDDFALASRLFDDDLDDALALFLSESPELPHCPGAENSVDRQRLGHVPHVAPETGFVDLIVRRERGGNGRPDAAKLLERRILGFRLAIFHPLSWYYLSLSHAAASTR